MTSENGMVKILTSREGYA